MELWPEELDAVLAAPDHHRVALDNERVRVLESRVEPGETVALHTHCWPAAYYVLSWSDFLRRDAEGRITLNTLEAGVVFESGQALWAGALGPHTLENVGDKALHIISVEIK